MRYRLSRGVPTLALAMATALTVRPVTAQMEAAKKECKTYGCAYLPQDVYYDSTVKEALAQLRLLKREEVKDDDEETLKTLESSGKKDIATLTLIGYKGGALETQINQDRAFCVAPYKIKNTIVESKLLGVFDGHARLGELVSEYTVTELPKLLAKKLASIEQEPEQVAKALNETFVEIDKTAPAEVSGGCTASIILQLGSKLYVANAGDSRSFIVVYRAKSKTVEVVYASREDKPDLPDEKARVEEWGGKVYIPSRGTSRVLYVDPDTGTQSGLAMSRSIGDWNAGKLGVIPDPIVDVIDIPELVEAQMATDPTTSDDVYVFAVSATDGLMDFASPEVIAQTVAVSLFDDEGPHLLTALEQLIYMAAQGWEQAKQGRYRDDIAIAVSQLRIPPAPPSQ